MLDHSSIIKCSHQQIISIEGHELYALIDDQMINWQTIAETSSQAKHTGRAELRFGFIRKKYLHETAEYLIRAVINK